MVVEGPSPEDVSLEFTLLMSTLTPHPQRRELRFVARDVRSGTADVPGSTRAA